MAPPKADFDAVPVIDFALAKTDRAAYFKQLKFACEDVGFGVSASILFSLQDVVVLLKHNRFSRTSQALKIPTRRRFSNWQTSYSPSLRNGRTNWALETRPPCADTGMRAELKRSTRQISLPLNHSKQLTRCISLLGLGACRSLSLWLGKARSWRP